MKTKSVTLFRKTLFIAFVLNLCFGSLSLFAQSDAANAGKEFYISYLPQDYTFIPQVNFQLKVVVEQVCTITAQYNNQPGVYWNNWNNTLVFPGIYTAEVSKDDVVYVPTFGTGEITFRTLKLTSTENVCVYAINYRQISTDATCVLPVSAWGTEYRLATGEPPSAYRSAYAVVAREAGTKVTLHNNSEIVLNENEVYHFLNATNNDMTGLKVTATSPVGLFSGATLAISPTLGYGCTGLLPIGSGDHTYEQLWSVNKWGNDFFAFPVTTPGSANWGGMLALVANENGTSITLSGGINGGTPLNYDLDAGEKQYICYVMSGLTRIVSNKQIMVFLVLPDATVMSILPTNQRIQHALVAPFILSGTSKINQHGIDLLVSAAYWNQAVIKHDGVVVSNSLYTVNPSTHFPDWYHIRKDLANVDIAIDISCPGGFLAYMSGSGPAESYGFAAGAGAFNLQDYFTIQEKGTTIDTYYENTTEVTHTFESSDIIVVKRTVETPFDSVTWFVNGIKYAITENTNIMNTLNFPASALHSGENTLTMSVRFSGTNADSLYTGKVWLSSPAAFYANNVHHTALKDTTFCNKTVNFHAEIDGFASGKDRIMWYIDDGTGYVEEIAAQDQLTWNKQFATGNYEIKMEVLYENGNTVPLTGTLKMNVLWIKIKNVRY